MSDKPVAMLVTSIFAIPVVMICCLGPVVVFSLLAGAFSWFIGSNLVLAISGVLVTMAITAGIYKLFKSSKSGTKLNTIEN